MKNGYTLLKTLTTTLNTNAPLIEEILSNGKESFSKNEKYINIGIGIINEVKDILINLDDEIYILNKRIYDTIYPIISYSNNLFNKYNIVNSYKLYDALSLDLKNLKDLLNSFSN